MLVDYYSSRLDEDQDSTDGESADNSGIAMTLHKSRQRNKRFNGECYRRGISGHKAIDCRKKNKERVSNHSAICTTGVVLATKISNKGSNELTLDSGASHHMVGSRKLLTDITKGEPIKISVANGNTSVGTLRGKLVTKLGGRMVTFENVLLVPGLKLNLLSITNMTRKNCGIHFSNEKCIVSRDNDVLVVGIRCEDGLYRVVADHATYSEVRGQVNAATPARNERAPLMVWHRRLGHVSPLTIVDMVKNNAVDGLKLKDQTIKTCDICEVAKSTKQPFQKSGDTIDRLGAAGEGLHFDVVGPMPNVSFGKRYMVHCVDDYSRCILQDQVERKDQVANSVVEIVKIVERSSGNKVKWIRTDGGKEFVNKTVVGFCRKNGIRFEKTAPYSSNQNGIVERANRTIEDMTRCMLHDSNLDNSYWSYAAKMAVCVKNRISTYGGVGSQGKIPLELLTGRRIDVSRTKAFGSKCWVHLHSNKRNKLDSRAVPCILLGMTDMNYIALETQSGRILESRDVTFDEERNYCNQPDTKLTADDTDDSSEEELEERLPAQQEVKGDNEIRDRRGSKVEYVPALVQLQRT